MTIPIPTPLNIETIASNTILIVKDDIHTAMVYPAKALLGASHLHFPDASLSTLKTLLLCNQAFALYIAKIHNIVPLMTIAEYEHDRTSSKNMLFHCLQ